MWEIWTNLLLPEALKSCPKSNKSPNLVTLLPTYLLKTLKSFFILPWISTYLQLPPTQTKSCGWPNPHKLNFTNDDTSNIRKRGAAKGAPSILLPRVRFPSTPSKLLSFIVTYSNCDIFVIAFVKRTKINIKRGHLKTFGRGLLLKYQICEGSRDNQFLISFSMHFWSHLAALAATEPTEHKLSSLDFVFCKL